MMGESFLWMDLGSSLIQFYIAPGKIIWIKEKFCLRLLINLVNYKKFTIYIF